MASTAVSRPKYRHPLFRMGMKLHRGRSLPWQGRVVSRHARNGHLPVWMALCQQSTSLGLKPCQCHRRGSSGGRPLLGRIGCMNPRALYEASSSSSHACCEGGLGCLKRFGKLGNARAPISPVGPSLRGRVIVAAHAHPLPRQRSAEIIKCLRHLSAARVHGQQHLKVFVRVAVC